MADPRITPTLRSHVPWTGVATAEFELEGVTVELGEFLVVNAHTADGPETTYVVSLRDRPEVAGRVSASLVDEPLCWVVEQHLLADARITWDTSIPPVGVLIEDGFYQESGEPVTYELVKGTEVTLSGALPDAPWKVKVLAETPTGDESRAVKLARAAKDIWFSGAHGIIRLLPPDPLAPRRMICGGFVVLAALESKVITQAERDGIPMESAYVADYLCSPNDTHGITDIVLDGETPDATRQSWTAQKGTWRGAMQRGSLVVWLDSNGITGSWTHIAIASGFDDDVYSLWHQNGKKPTRISVRDLISCIGLNGAIKILTPRWHSLGGAD